MRKKQPKKPRKKLRTKKSRHISKKAVVVLVAIVVVISFFMIRPRLTGFTSVKKEYSIADKVNITVNESGKYVWEAEQEGILKSLKLSGTVLRQGSAKVYLNYSNQVYLVFDSEQLDENLNILTGMVVANGTISNQTIEEDSANESIVIEEEQSNNETQVNESVEIEEEQTANQTQENVSLTDEPLINETLNLTNQAIVNDSIDDEAVNQTIINQTEADEPSVNQSSEELPIEKSVQLVLKYYNNSNYDVDNNGFEEIDGVVDLGVEDTEFNFNASPDNMCTKWIIESVDKDSINQVCYGSSSCCNFLDMDSTSAEWDDVYYSYFEKDGAGYNNVVSAQVVYAYYNFTSLEADIAYSNSSSLSVKFKAPYIEFNDICMETCLLPGINESKYTLVFEIENNTLDIDSIAYVIERKIKKDNPPKLSKNISDIKIVKDKDYTINLSKYFSDKDGDVLAYSFYETDNLSVTVEGDIAVITPDKGFIGVRSSFFIANDSKLIGISNVFKINVSEAEEVTVAKPKVVIGKPVKWVKRVKLKEPVQNISINITNDAFNISVRDLVANVELNKSKIKVVEDNKVKKLEEYESEKEIEREEKEEEFQADKITGFATALTGFSVAGSADADSIEANITELIIEEPVEEIEVEYYTEGPKAEEIEISEHRKRIVISSDIHYENILSYTYLPIEVPINSIKLYWIRNGSRTRVSIDKFDTNNNSLIDYIEWIVPSLSNQTYELELVILNAQSYPTRGGNWTVRFNTNGVGNLTISASNETSYSEIFEDNSSTIDDLELMDLRCGDNAFFNKDSLFMQNNTYLILRNNTRIKINESLNSSLEVASLFVENYFCNATAYHTVRVLTDGKHTQLFDFSGYSSYAHNLVNNIPITSIVVFSDMNSTRTKVFLS